MHVHEQLQQEIIDRGYAEIEHGIPNGWVEEVVQAYADFTVRHPDPLPSTMDAMLPTGTTEEMGRRLDDLQRSADTQQQWHKYRTNVVGVGKPDGYTNRSFQVSALARARGLHLPEEDPKEFYHHTPVHMQTMVQTHMKRGWGPIPKEVTTLDASLARIHTKLRELVSNICYGLEQTHSGITKIITPEGLHTSPLRMLFYHPSTNTQRAGAHYDKSLLTLQLAESHRGLQVTNTPAEPLQSVVRNDDKAVMFVSPRFSEVPHQGNPLGGHFPDSALRPAWHDVVASTEPNTGRFIPASAVEVCARWALIFFVNEHSFVVPSKVSMHTR